MTRLLKTIYNKRVYFVYIPLVIHWITILILTSLPGDSLPELHFDDKIKHFTAYLVLSIFLTLALRLQQTYPTFRDKYLKISFFITIFYATIDELHQLFIPGRDADILDWLADFFGILLGLWIIRKLSQKYFDYFEAESGTDVRL